MAGASLLCVGLLGAANADPYYAKTISSNAIYNLRADGPGGSISSSVFWSGGTALGGIATFGHYMAVTDNLSTTSSVLRVFDMTPGVSTPLLGSIELSQAGAGKVTVDGNGNAYVAYQNTDSAKFAVVSIPNWQTPTTANSIATGSASGCWAFDIDTTMNGAVVLGRNIPGQGDPVGGVKAFGVDSTGHANPTTTLSSTGTAWGIAANAATGDTYSVADTSTVILDGNGHPQVIEQSTVFSKNIGMADIALPFTFSGVAQDIALLNGSLAVVGRMGSSGTLWKIGLGADGSPVSNPLNTFLVGDAAGSLHTAAGSPAGDMLWVASQSGGVYGLDFAGWTVGSPAASQLTLSDSIIDLATHDYIAPVAVPEPSSLLALITLGAGAFGVLRRRGR